MLRMSSNFRIGGQGGDIHDTRSVYNRGSLYRDSMQDIAKKLVTRISKYKKDGLLEGLVTDLIINTVKDKFSYSKQNKTKAFLYSELSSTLDLSRLSEDLKPIVHKVLRELITTTQAGQAEIPGKENSLAYDSKFKGKVFTGEIPGQGACTSATGDKYEGAWVDRKKHGQGTFTWANGDKYEGEWREGKKTRSGNLHFF